MTRFTVVWAQSAQGELADLWVSAPDRKAITAATQAIDRELGRDALIKGNDLSEGLRALVIPPLRILFTVKEDDRIVEVLRIRRF